MKRRSWVSGSLFMVMILLLNMFPVSIRAAGEVWIEISDADGLSSIGSNLSGNYRLTADINLGGTEWNPIGPFTGKLDGNSKIIKNFTINDTSTSNKGLFSSIGAAGQISNLGIENANITAGNYAGILAGTNSGTITRSYTKGSVNGSDHIGGLVGDNSGTIVNSFTQASVSGKDYLGGLAGANSGTVQKSYTASSLSPSVFNNYVQFNGTPVGNYSCPNSGGYIDIPHQDIYVGDKFTLEAWFQWGNVGTQDINFIMGKGPNQFEIHTGGSNTNGLRFIPIWPDSNSDSWLDIKNAIHPGWFHVAAVYEYKSDSHQATAQVYINGEAPDLWQGTTNIGKIATLSRSTNTLGYDQTGPQQNHINIGRRTDGWFYFNGKICDVRFWNIARTGEDIKRDKDKVLTGNESGLVGYWKLNEASGDAIDSSTTHNNGTLVGDVVRIKEASATHKGGLIGQNTGTVSDSYYDLNVSGQTDSIGTPETTAAMKFQSTFTNWDFTNTWGIDSGINAGYPYLLSADATLKAALTVKGQTVTDLGTPNAVLGSETAGSVTITAAKAADTSNTGSFITLFDKNESHATVKVVKYASGDSTANFITDNAYANQAIADGDFFIVQVTAQDTTTINYYRINVTVTPAPTYTMSVSTLTAFASQTSGYGAAPAAQTVTITNTGNQTITLNQPTATNYDIGTLSATSIGAGGTATFTVQPKTGLGVGTYNETINISNTDGGTASVATSFSATAVPTYTMSVSTLTAFASQTAGYGAAPAAQTVTITNSGNQTITLNQPTATNYDIGTLSATSIGAGGTATFTVQPKTGLGVGTYNETINISNTDGGTASVAASFSVTVTPSSDAGLTSVLSQIITAGAQAGTSGTPKTASISIANGVATVAASDIVKHDAGATMIFYGTDSSFTTPAAGSISLTAGAGSDVYIKVVAADSSTLYYKVTINRATAQSSGGTGENTTPNPPSGSGVDILVNGKTETAATSTTSQEGDKTVTTITVDDKKVEEKLQTEGNNTTVTITVNNNADVVVGQLNGQTVKNMETKDAVLEIKTENVTYTLPASQINIDNVSDQIGSQVELKDIKVNVAISAPPQDTARVVEDTANKNNYQVVVKPIEFSITCTSGNKTIEVSRFNGYVERLVAIPDGIDPSRITTGIVLNSDGTFSHVPTVITIINGKYYAKINSLTNSTYSVIWSPKTFKDVENIGQRMP